MIKETQNDVLTRAVEELESMSRDKDFSLAALKREMALHDFVSYTNEARREGYEKGVASGFEKGEASGFEKGEASGFEKGAHKTLLASTRSLMRSTGWSAEQALETLNVPEAERASLMAELTLPEA